MSDYRCGRCSGYGSDCTCDIDIKPEAKAPILLTWYHLVDFAVPSVPNFVRSIDGKHTVDVGDLTESECREIGELWTNKLMSHMRSRKAGNEKDKRRS